MFDFGISIGIKILTFPGISISMEIEQTKEKSQYQNRLRFSVQKASNAGSCLKENHLTVQCDLNSARTENLEWRINNPKLIRGPCDEF